MLEHTRVVTSTLDNSTVNDTSLVIVECKIMYGFIITRHVISMTLYVKKYYYYGAIHHKINVIDLLATNTMYVISTGIYSKKVKPHKVYLHQPSNTHKYTVYTLL